MSVMAPARGVLWILKCLYFERWIKLSCLTMKVFKAKWLTKIDESFTTYVNIVYKFTYFVPTADLIGLQFCFNLLNCVSLKIGLACK